MGARAGRGAVAQHRQETHAVLGRVRRQGRLRQRGERGQEIDLADQLIAHARLHPRGPAHDERHAVPALEEVGLVPAQRAARLVALGDELVDRGRRRAAVVGGEDHQRVAREPFAFQCGEHAADLGVDLAHEISVGVEPALALPFLRRDDRGVRGGQGHVGEERAPGLGVRGVLGDVGADLVGQRGQDIDGFELRARGPAAQPFLGRGRQLRRETVLDPDERRHVQGSADPEVTVKAMLQRAVLDGLRVVEAADRTLGGVDRVARLRRRPAVRGPFHAQMPFAEAGGAVALRLEHPRHREPARRDQRRRPAPEHAALQARPPVVATGEEAVARRRADARGRMPVREAPAFGRQTVEVRGRDFARRVVGPHVPVALVVGQDQEDVGSVGRQARPEQA